jgi:imidazoleglycerol-phosphate dehydratase / histidinol-phosphatase
MKRVLFLDRDGTLIVEPPDDFQIHSLEILEFLPGVFRNLYRIKKQMDFELVIVSNQDGLGTKSHPEDIFNLVQSKVLQAFINEGIEFDRIFIDRSLPEEKLPTRKPGTGMLGEYLTGNYDLANSFVIGDRLTDIELAGNLGAKGILIKTDNIKPEEIQKVKLKQECVFIADKWEQIYYFLRKNERSVMVERTTSETTIHVELSLDGTGQSDISTGLGFLDHMLEQLSKHSGCDIIMKASGDLQVDEHHLIEDVALSLGEAFRKALGKKTGIERFGFIVPMDDSVASVAIDFGGRNWLEWDVKFNREKIGDVPTEMFRHFFKSFSDTAQCNLNISAKGENEHHKIESVFKALARAIKMATHQDSNNMQIPSTKGSI